MFVVITRNFPPEVGGMQTLMGDLASILSEHGPVKVFADHADGSEAYDKKKKYSKLPVEILSKLQPQYYGHVDRLGKELNRDLLDLWGYNSKKD